LVLNLDVELPFPQMSASAWRLSPAAVSLFLPVTALAWVLQMDVA
jgi:hypothetical protein